MRRVLLAALAVVLGTAGLSAAAEGSQPLPVSYNFLGSAVLAGVQNTLPGANDWSCKPTAAHPRPVVLVHGTLGNKNTNWQTYGPLLKNNGYCTYSFTYGAPGGNPEEGVFGGLGSMNTSAQQMATFVSKVLKATGAKKVDIIGHSQGTLMPNYYAKFLGGAKYIKNYVSLASLWHGTGSADAVTVAGAIFGLDEDTAPVCTACAQFGTNSAWLKRLRKGGVAVKGITYTNIVTEHDQLVRPYTSGIEPGMTNHVVQDYCATDISEHFEIASDPVASVLVLNALDPAHTRAVPCMLVLPYTGPIG